MNKKYCDKCNKEIKGDYFLITAYEESTEDGEEKEDNLVIELEYCPECYKEIEF